MPLLLLTCALFCAACAAAADRLPPLMKIVREVRHTNGLVLGVPEGFEAKTTGGGFVVEPSGDANREVRRPVIARVSFVAGDAPSGASAQTKSIGEREFRYVVARSEGGSGGEVYTLDVYERVQGGHLRCTQAAQSDAGEPDFALCWTLANSAKYQQPTNN